VGKVLRSPATKPAIDAQDHVRLGNRGQTVS
jgi:hypothetical protein